MAMDELQKLEYRLLHLLTGIILGMNSANERPCFIVTSFLIGWAHT